VIEARSSVTCFPSSSQASEKLYIGKNNVKNNKEKLNTPVLKNNIVINDLQTAMQIKYNKELFREKIREKIKNKA